MRGIGDTLKRRELSRESGHKNYSGDPDLKS